MIDTINLLCRKDPTIKATQDLPIDRWGYWEDFGFPLTSPADLREGFEPTSNLNLLEDATHQITFDGGKHWTNVILEEGNPAYYVACSDGKRSWLVDNFSCHKDRVVKRPEPLSIHSTNDGLDAMRTYAHKVTGRISDPQPQPVVYGGGRGGIGKGQYFIDLPTRTEEVHCTAHVDYDPASRIPASVGESPTCDFTDSCFDSDPSVVGE